MTRILFLALVVATFGFACGCFHLLAQGDGLIRVRVTGRVVHPGEYSLPKGATIQRAIDGAGGIYDPTVLAPLAELTHSNRPIEKIDIMNQDWRTTVLVEGDTVRIPLFGF